MCLKCLKMFERKWSFIVGRLESNARKLMVHFFDFDVVLLSRMDWTCSDQQHK